MNKQLPTFFLFLMVSLCMYSNVNAQSPCLTNIVNDGDFSQIISNSAWTKTGSSWGVTNGYALAVLDGTSDNLSQTLNNIYVNSSGNIVVEFDFATNNGLNSGTDPDESTATLNVIFKGTKYLSLTNPTGYGTTSVAVSKTVSNGATASGQPYVSAALNNLTFYHIRLTIPSSGQSVAGTLTFQYSAKPGIDDIAIDNVVVQGYIAAPTTSANTALTTTTTNPTVDLAQSIVSTTPSGYSLVWYTSNPPSGSAYTDPASASAGTYYAYYTDGSCLTSASSVITVTASTVLPVLYASPLAASNIAGNVLLKWTTATEINNKGFEIQRSSDGSKFTSIGFVNSKVADGTGSGTDYSFTDKTAPTETNYYRLVQTDLDNKTTLSNIVSIYISGNGTQGLSVYPNPARGATTVSGLQTGSLISVISMDGRIVKSLLATSPTQQLDISGLATGMYVVKTVINGVPSVVRFMVR